MPLSSLPFIYTGRDSCQVPFPDQPRSEILNIANLRCLVCQTWMTIIPISRVASNHECGEKVQSKCKTR